MSNLSNRNPEFSIDELEGGNLLWDYIKSMNPETVAQLSKPSVEVASLMDRKLRGMLGVLPPQHFDVMITTSREDLSQLLASAMLSGYFLNNAKQRLDLEQSISVSGGYRADSTDDEKHRE